jgi:hypothetical protein
MTGAHSIPSSAGRTTTLVVNIALFQIGWFACVLGGASGRPWLGSGIAAAVVGWHLWRSAQPRRELALLGLAGAIGFGWDSLLVALGVFSYPSGTLAAGTAPVWMLMLWLVFATTLNVSLRWMKTLPVPAIAIGAIGGPLAYYAGFKLGAVEFADPVVALGAQAAGWSVILPLLLMLSLRYDGRMPAIAKEQVPCST